MKLKNLGHKILCFFGFHNWKHIKDTDIEKCEFCGVYKDDQDWLP